ncbi:MULTISPECIES: heavy-metal-associated domain-containing protein [Rhodobacter group]|uniref:Heavy-metal-associated domain-containing protein n=1 Tax=Rhodobacter flavimaris TaxID=2907145 RepID=A0ABS8YV61_9RHOB|nr:MULTISPECIES: heavy-metal-associated domain-containing protein [Paracoccaceae]MBW0157012.1 heavy-metal-associated domain-containing protein [Sedimentimonas flavescens]MCE5973739.1 heavy-metal-associated domain-containing protein [Sinirhodobacter sp. WL0062]MCT2539504.1 heavy-metal-associated domain-containing protein [Sedimentimonas flavescens]WBL32760.1 heavy-metal-associated domain-containing protein [Sinirhodobacter sp. HNIBRBA609]
MILSVPNMTCGHCKAAVEAAIVEVGGKADINLADREVEVNGLPEATVLAALKAAGYEAEVIE